MKKLVALVLILGLALSMASVALAAEVQAYQTLDSVWIDPLADRDGARNDHDDRLLPGGEYILWYKDYYAFDLRDLKSVSIEWTKGGAMVESVKIKKKGTADAYVLLTLKENYTITDAKELIGDVTLKFTEASGRGDMPFSFTGIVGNDLVELDGWSKKADAKDNAVAAFDNTVYKCTDAGYLAFNSDTRLFSMVLRMVKDEKAFMYSDEEMIEAIEDQYGHLDAEINCYSFGGRPTFTNAAEFTLQADYADQYFVYEWDGKKLTKQSYTWNSIEGEYEWSTKSPKAYVISDKELVVADEESGNPETGGN